MGKELSIYVHIPFCKRKCLYCDFLSFCPSGDQMDEYFGALKREICSVAESLRDREVISVFFGGGTPSFPEAENICFVFEFLRDNFHFRSDAEISIEVNPASAISDKLTSYRKAGFNRLSIGAQSVNDDELRRLGRLHDSSMFFETFENARKAGFDNINVDLMSALPGQKTEEYLNSLSRVCELGPEHISAYSLIVEEGTPFFDMDLDLPSEEEDRLMYHETGRFLAEYGYHRYEISNYALSRERECLHNKVYWKRGNYLGLGLGAASMVDNVRWSNTRDIAEYSDKAGREETKVDVQKLSEKEQMEEFMFLGLRLVEGVSTAAFRNEFGRDIFAVYGNVIEKYTASGHLVLDEDSLRLSDPGLDVSNTVMADFLFDN